MMPTNPSFSTSGQVDSFAHHDAADLRDWRFLPDGDYPARHHFFDKRLSPQASSPARQSSHLLQNAVLHAV
ncbi:MAG: hypothetical protein H8F28_05650 [Fibrella sp.]|nr:hypothetical protein [Armatimonadota bacterium]